jgi:hypothetical protein
VNTVIEALLFLLAAAALLHFGCSSLALIGMGGFFLSLADYVIQGVKP